MKGWRDAVGPRERRVATASGARAKDGQSISQIVKKYTAEKPADTARLAAFVTELERQSKTKTELKRQLEQTIVRIEARKNDFSRRQRRVREQEREKAQNIEDEYARMKIENSCLNIEKRKLRVQIDEMRNEIAKMISEDEEKRLYFEAGIPISKKNETNFSQMYNISNIDTHSIKHSGQKPKTIIKKKVASRMGNFTSSPDVKIKDTFKTDHLRFEKMKDVFPKHTNEAEDSVFAKSDDGSKTCTLLNRINLRPQKPFDGHPRLKNILTGVHKPSILGSPKLSKAKCGRSMFKSHDIEGFKGVNRNEEDSVNLSRSRLTLVQPTRPESRITVKSRIQSGKAELPRERADQVLVRMDNIAKNKFGQGYIDWIAVLAEVNNKILIVEKKIKKRLKFNRQTLLVVLNLVLCFKRAFYILKFQEGIRAGGIQRELDSNMPADFALSVAYDKLTDLATRISHHAKSLLNPDLEAKLEPLKLMKFKRDQSRSSITSLLGWTPKFDSRKMTNRVPDSFDLKTQLKTEAGASNKSALSTPQSTPHLRALEPIKQKLKIYDVTKPYFS